MKEKDIREIIIQSTVTQRLIVVGVLILVVVYVAYKLFLTPFVMYLAFLLGAPKRELG